MVVANRSPIDKLGVYDSLDYRIFKDHLRLPKPYLNVIFRKWRFGLKPAVINLHKVFAAVDKHGWERIVDNATLIQRQYKVANIPAPFFADRPVKTTREKDQPNFRRLANNVEKLAGRVLYFHSLFCDAALAAATIMVKRAIEKRITCYCTSFSAVVADYKADWNTTSNLQGHVRQDDLVVIYAVGSEYTTDFTTGLLHDIRQHRVYAGRTTIICSSLSPADYAVRYPALQFDVEIGFVDEKIAKTLADLVKELGLDD